MKSKKNDRTEGNMGEFTAAAERCLAFIGRSVSCFHTIANAEEMLREKEFAELKEKDEWKLEEGRGYYVKRNDSSMIAFRIPERKASGFHIVASHSDSPTFKLKKDAETAVEKHYVKLNVEPYGGAFYASWLDRSLSLAGRVVCREGDGLQTRLVNIDEDLLVIPNLAMHMDRERNKNLAYNPQVDLQPIMCASFEGSPVGEREKDGKEAQEGKEQESKDVKKAGAEDVLKDRIAFYAGTDKEKILGMDLFLYVREKGKLAGADKELMLSPKLDDLECVYASLEGFLSAEPEDKIAVCAIFDNEEVGSRTMQGAASDFLKAVLERVGEGLGCTGSGYKRLLADSFMISADNGHAVHPNHPEKTDPTNRVYLNQGIVLKFSGNQKYTTDAYSEAVIRDLCEKEQIPCQSFCNRSDIPGGSTLGNISAAQVSVPTADIGLAQLAMHSAVETAGSRDVAYLIRLVKCFYGK